MQSSSGSPNLWTQQESGSDRSEFRFSESILTSQTKYQSIDYINIFVLINLTFVSVHVYVSTATEVALNVVPLVHNPVVVLLQGVVDVIPQDPSGLTIYEKVSVGTFGVQIGSCISSEELGHYQQGHCRK